MKDFNYELLLFNNKEATEVIKNKLFTIGAFIVSTDINICSRRGDYEEII